MRAPFLFLFFFFNDTATTEIYTLSLHDALPISDARPDHFARADGAAGAARCLSACVRHCVFKRCRSEEHTSELQSQSNLVCRLLLEKKKNINSLCAGIAGQDALLGVCDYTRLSL